MTSLREQWTTIIRKKINQEIEKITATPEYEVAFDKAKKEIYKKAKIEQICIDYEKGCQREQELQTELSRLRETNRRLNEERQRCVKDVPEYSGNGNSFRSYSFEERVKIIANPIMIEDRSFCFSGKLKQLTTASETIDTQFLIATTPKQLKEAAESIIDSLGWTVKDLM